MCIYVCILLLLSLQSATFLSHDHHFKKETKPAMEALWNLEEKWKVTTQGAILLFACTAFALIGLCTTATLLRRKAQRNQVTSSEDPTAGPDNMSAARWSGRIEPNRKLVTIRRVLMGSVRWSEGSEWEDTRSAGSWGPERPSPFLLGSERFESGSVGRLSHNSVSPVWQRPILMGEKCELPRFSGLILYDQRGRLLDHSLTSFRREDLDQEKPAAAPMLRTTLRDLF